MDIKTNRFYFKSHVMKVIGKKLYMKIEIEIDRSMMLFVIYP